MILTRTEFVEHWNNIKPGLGDYDSALWAYERDRHRASEKCGWFILCKSIKISDDSLVKQDYWQWCNEHCKGNIFCFSSSEEEEWWGFSRQEDIMLWVLRWL
jgi:hypothetical protein